MSNTQSKYGRRFDEEFKREVAALACKPGAKQEQVARDLGVSPYSVSRWKKLLRRDARRRFSFWRQRPRIGTPHQGT